MAKSLTNTCFLEQYLLRVDGCRFIQAWACLWVHRLREWSKNSLCIAFDSNLLKHCQLDNFYFFILNELTTWQR